MSYYLIGWKRNLTGKNGKVIEQHDHPEYNDCGPPEAVIGNVVEHELLSEQGAAKNDAGRGEVDDKSGHVDQSSDQWGGSAGGVQTKFSKGERQHGTGYRSE